MFVLLQFVQNFLFKKIFFVEVLLSLLRSLSRIFHEKEIEIKLFVLSCLWCIWSVWLVQPASDSGDSWSFRQSCLTSDSTSFSSRWRQRLHTGIFMFCWFIFPVLLCPIAFISSASISLLPLLVVSRFIFELLLIIKNDRFSSRKIDSDGIDCRRFVFLET